MIFKNCQLNWYFDFWEPSVKGIYIHPTLTPPVQGSKRKELPNTVSYIHTDIPYTWESQFLIQVFSSNFEQVWKWLSLNVECGFHYCHSKSCSSLLASLLLQIFGCHKIKFQVLKKRWGFYYNKSTHRSIKRQPSSSSSLIQTP
jgi:hypothetical protein